MCTRILIFAHDWGGSLVVFISLTAFLVFHGYAYRLNRVNFALAKHNFYALHQAQILHRFFKWHRTRQLNVGYLHHLIPSLGHS